MTHDPVDLTPVACHWRADACRLALLLHVTDNRAHINFSLFGERSTLRSTSGIGLGQFKRGTIAGHQLFRQRVHSLAIQYLANQGSQFIDPNRLAGDMANPVALLGFLVELIAVARDDDDRDVGAHLL